jgi:hypothetical protein
MMPLPRSLNTRPPRRLDGSGGANGARPNRPSLQPRLLLTSLALSIVIVGARVFAEFLCALSTRSQLILAAEPSVVAVAIANRAKQIEIPCRFVFGQAGLAKVNSIANLSGGNDHSLRIRQLNALRELRWTKSGSVVDRCYGSIPTHIAQSGAYAAIWSETTYSNDWSRTVEKYLSCPIRVADEDNQAEQFKKRSAVQPTAKIFAEYTAPALKLAQNNTLLVKETSGRRDASAGAGYKNG